jgi:hypothetical protein
MRPKNDGERKTEKKKEGKFHPMVLFRSLSLFLSLCCVVYADGYRSVYNCSFYGFEKTIEEEGKKLTLYTLYSWQQPLFSVFIVSRRTCALCAAHMQHQQQSELQRPLISPFFLQSKWKTQPKQDETSPPPPPQPPRFSMKRCARNERRAPRRPIYCC